MKNDSLSATLIGVLFLSAVLSLVFCGLYTKSSRDTRLLQSQIGNINNRRAYINALAGETLEYSKKNPAIDPILESAGVKPPTVKPAPATSSKPATK